MGGADPTPVAHLVMDSATAAMDSTAARAITIHNHRLGEGVAVDGEGVAVDTAAGFGSAVAPGVHCSPVPCSHEGAVPEDAAQAVVAVGPLPVSSNWPPPVMTSMLRPGPDICLPLSSSRQHAAAIVWYHLDVAPNGARFAHACDHCRDRGVRAGTSVVATLTRVGSPPSHRMYASPGAISPPGTGVPSTSEACSCDRPRATLAVKQSR